MCLIGVSWRSHPEFPLIVAANRDEFRERPSQSLHVWGDGSGIIGGRDVQAGGTWMGLTMHGRFAAITNYREPGREIENAPTRGHLVTDFLRATISPMEYLQDLQSRGEQYNGFNLLVCDPFGMAYYGNRAAEPQLLDSGTFGLSNALLDTPWPKVERLKSKISENFELKDKHALSESLHEVLTDTSVAADAELPDTGVGLDLERRLSAMHISGGKYGTRASTVLLIDRMGCAHVAERHFPDAESPGILSRIEAQLTPPP